jgi:hypothetical protein
MGHERAPVLRARRRAARLLDHLGDLEQDLVGERDPQRLGGLEVDREADGGRLRTDS